MSKILLLNSKEVKGARNHPTLKSKKLIASGMFSGVYEGNSPETVLKLTICPASYAMLTDSRFADNPHATKLINDYGQVGEFMTGTNIIETKLTKPVKRLVPMYLVEIERLHKTANSDAKKVAAHVSRAMRKAIMTTFGDESHRDNQAKALRKLASDSKLIGKIESYAEYFECLIAFVEGNRNAFFDMHQANTMMREDGTVVFSDPIGSNDVYETQGIFAGILSNSDVNWSEVKQDHKARFGHLAGMNKDKETSLSLTL